MRKSGDKWSKFKEIGTKKKKIKLAKEKKILSQTLKCKLYGGTTLKWIDSFLCFRQQRVVVNGIKSDWIPFLSGVPQSTVLGPLLFSLYINDITIDIDSEIRLFADDCVCFAKSKVQRTL